MKKLVLYRYFAKNSSFSVYFFLAGSDVLFFLNYKGKPFSRFSLPRTKLLGIIDYPHMLSLLAYGTFCVMCPLDSFFCDLDVVPFDDFPIDFSCDLLDVIIYKYGISHVEPVKYI